MNSLTAKRIAEVFALRDRQY